MIANEMQMHHATAWVVPKAKMPVQMAIKISGVDIDPGTEGDTILNSVTFG